MTLGLRWLTNYSRLRNENTMVDRLANEIIDASNGTGALLLRRKKILIKWQKLTKLSHISVGNIFIKYKLKEKVFERRKLWLVNFH